MCNLIFIGMIGIYFTVIMLLFVCVEFRAIQRGSDSWKPIEFIYHKFQLGRVKW